MYDGLMNYPATHDLLKKTQVSAFDELIPTIRRVFELKQEVYYALHLMWRLPSGLKTNSIDMKLWRRRWHHTGLSRLKVTANNRKLIFHELI
jgi:hypothetical protein